MKLRALQNYACKAIRLCEARSAEAISGDTCPEIASPFRLAMTKYGFCNALKLRALCTVFFICISFTAIWAEEPAPYEIWPYGKEDFIESAKADTVLKIGLVDCIAYAIKGNKEIATKRIEPKLKDGDIRIAKSDFEPTLTFDYELHDTDKKTTTTISPYTLETEDMDFNAGIAGKLITGTEYDIDFSNKRYESDLVTQRYDPYYTTDPKITVTQPLFRNFGILVNRADIIIAQNDKSVSEESFKETVMDVITRTKVAYYQYIYYRDVYSLARLSSDRAKDLLEINRARYAKGLISSVDLLETETAVAQREKSLITAEANFKKAEDDLKLITGIVEDPGLWNARIEPIDEPEFAEYAVDLVRSMENAFTSRPDYLSALTDMKSRDIKIKTARNALFPTVDLSGSFGLNGLGEKYGKALENTDWGNQDWSVGAAVSVPWGGEERAKYDQRNLEKAQAIINLKKLAQDIILEVRDKTRQVEIQGRQVGAAKLSKEKETENYAAQEERYAAGQASTHDMLDYQNRLSQAEVDYIKAIVDYNAAIFDLDKAEGTTLVKNDIKLEE